ncbi:tannase/feruloyl esterase family alpha/beta hydrolase [Tolumonas osonensis]|uniref:Feruloyl esterase n=1 Tax=Tolumonas osonensis TaxID=675874 RepID=A0A841GID3_9GAMM|nr:tannase/feruloyl esterase family alpha/beta hydrolase [Tolumonas osonensis]MBB6054991.1 feruloyl esterase [Tolumonas osonensis]
MGKDLFRITQVAMIGISLFSSHYLYAATTTIEGKPDGASLAQSIKPVTSCSSLASVDLTVIGGAGSNVTSATASVIDGQSVCTVEGVLAPSIGFKVKLPENNWQQRFLQIGCGGLCGSISEQVGAASGCEPVTNGEFVISATDMGHQGMGGEFGKDPQKRADFAFRSLHLTSVTSKALIKAFYGKDPAYSYFSGCSDGGREALIEAQRYPDDFDGIIAGAPAMNFEVQNGIYHPWLAQSNTGKDGKPIVLANRLPLIHQAVLEKCDTLDGQKDGLISEPLSCQFDPAILQCKTGEKDAADCLTQEEVTAVQRFYKGPTDPTTGKSMIAGGPLPGSELAWAGVFVPNSKDEPIFSKIIASGARSVLFKDIPDDTNFSFSTMKFDSKLFADLKAMHSFYDSTNPDLSAFYARGGKLILWHGWADQHISPVNTIEYHKAVVKFMGEKKASAFERLYLLPGMYHCEGGEGPNQIDLLTPMMNWVEQGHAPQAILAKKPHVDEKTDFGTPVRDKKGGDAAAKPVAQTKIDATRPVYPFPYIAVYKKHGDVNEAENYQPVKMKNAGKSPDWLGNDLFKPYPLIN